MVPAKQSSLFVHCTGKDTSVSYPEMATAYNNHLDIVPMSHLQHLSQNQSRLKNPTTAELWDMLIYYM